MTSNNTILKKYSSFILIGFSLFLFHSLPSIAQITSFNKPTGNLQYQKLDPKTTKIAPQNFESWLKTKKHLPANTTLKTLQSEKDPLGFTHQRYQVLQSGIPIEGSVLISHSNEKNILTSYNGSLFDVKNINTQAKITPKEALQKAIKHVDAETYRWEIAAENEHRKHITNNQQNSYLPIPQLVIAPKNLNFQTQDFHLTYKIDIYALRPLQRLWVYIDAQTGEVIATQNQLCSIHTPTVDKVSPPYQNPLEKHLSISPSLRSNLSPPSPNLCASVPPCSITPHPNIQASINPTILEDTQATAVTKYSGIQTITTDQQADTYLLQEQARNIATYNMHQSDIFSNATVFEDQDNYWDNFNEDQDEVATDVHWAIEQTYDYYLEKYGRKSFDGKGIAIRSYVHYVDSQQGDTYLSAFWDGDHLSFGDGDNEQRSAVTSLDVCAHEYTHAITDYTANLIYNDESGGLNESFSDIFAIAVEHYAKPSTANFLLGEETVLGEVEAIRSAAAPKTLYSPDTYKGEYWSPNPGHVHNHGTVQTHWFYLLVNGGEGVNDFDQTYQVESIGLEAATDIAYRNLSVYLTPPSNYADARFFSIRAAMDLYGDCSFEAEQVAKAWYAVGVGETEIEQNQVKFVVKENEFCSEEATLQFTNQSIGASSYVWDFGDGSSSVEVHPIHTYQNFGDYTVQLTATYCDGSQETFTQENPIRLSPDSYACNPVNMSFEEEQNLTDCKGILYDDGGKLGDYTRNEQSSLTIEVEDADYITLDFNEFDVSNYHELYIYDGKNRNAPSITKNWGSLIPNQGQPIVTSGNAVHLYFDAYIDPLFENQEERTFPGFEAFWTCHQTNQKPQITSLSFNDDFACQGQASFRHRTLYQAHEWHWDFGDNKTSMEENPTHTYQEDGWYDIQLIACNDFGCDTLKREKYIEINQSLVECHELQVPKTGKKTADNCEGVIYDSGGKNASYKNNSDGILVVQPPSIERLGFVINTFNTEAQDDILLIYDGTSIEAPLLLNKSGTSFLKDTIWAESGAITLHFRSNENVTNRGFEIFYFSTPKEELPTADFNWLPTEVALQVPISFKNQSLFSNQWYWDFGDEQTSKTKNPTRIFSESGDFNVTLTAKNCYATDILQKQITVQSNPNLQIPPENIQVTLMAGSSANQTINLSNIGTGDLYFGTKTGAFEEDTLIERFYTKLDTATYLFDNVHPISQFYFEVTINGDFDEGSEYMWLRIEDEEYQLVGINDFSAENGTDIKAVFSYDAEDEEVVKWLEDEQLKVEIWHGLSVGLNEGGKDYYQIRLVTDHDDWLRAAKNGVIQGESDKEFQLTFDASHLWAGTYTNELQILTNESTNPQKIIPCTLEVLPHPVAFFEQVGNMSCEGSVVFQDKSINNPDSWEWDFGDGMTSMEQNPTHQFATKGEYEVSLKVCKNGVCDETSKSTFIAPTAKFSFFSNDILFNSEVVFTNLSQGGTSYLWDFGDGTTSTQKHPKHVYEEGGNYSVRLITQTCFQSDTSTQTLRIQTAPEANVAIDTLKVSLNAGEQSLQKIPIQNNGMGDLYYEASLQHSLGKSTKTFEEAGDKTLHVFEGVGEGVGGFLQLKITLNGDFDAANERVWLRLDGEGMEYVLDNNTESAEDETHIITLDPPVYRHLLADRELSVELENTQQVGIRSDRTNQHTVELMAHGARWLSLSKENETVGANTVDSLGIVFDASSLNAGIYDFLLQINTNESDHSNHTVPIELQVFGMAEMEWSAATIDFGEVRVNESISKPFEVFNTGTDTLFVTSMGAQSAVFEANTTTLILPPKTSYEGILTFMPTSIKVFEENFEVQSNVNTQNISLIGKGIGLPQILVSPDSLFVALAIGEQTERTVSVFNTGAYELSFSAQNATFTRFDSLITQDFHKIGDTTVHVFENLQETDSLQLEFNIVGDFNRKNEFADVYVNGEWKERLGDLVNDSTFNIQDTLTFAWADLANGQGFEEGKLEVMLVNSEEVNLGITISPRHEVRLKTFDDAWLESNEEQTAVAIEESKLVVVDFDARNIDLGTYYQDIEVFANDPTQPVTIVPTTLVVYQKPQANFAVALEEVCSGVVQFENLSSENTMEWHWDFGDGSTSMEKNPEHIYTSPNDYEVELVAVHEFTTDTLRFNLEVDFTIADFEVPDTVFNDKDFGLTNNSLGAVNFFWDFGDEMTSTLESPLHQYDTTGVYTIQLVTESANGCLDTLQKDIVVELEVGIEASNPLPDWLQIYPNPVESDLTIEVHRMFSEGIEVKLFNALGQLVESVYFEGKRQQIEVDDLPKGVYYLKLEMQDFSGVQKVVVR